MELFALAFALLSGSTVAPPARPVPRDVVIVLNKGEATASLIDAATGVRIGLVPTGTGPHEAAASPDGRIAVVADYGDQTPGKTLTVVDLVGAKVVRTIDLGDHRRPHGIAWVPGTRQVAVTSETSKAVLLVDVDAGTAAAVLPTDQAGTHLLALSADGRTAVTANIGSGTVTRLDLAARAAVRTGAAGPQSEAIDLSPDGREIWVGSNSTHRITVLDATTLDSLGSFAAGGEVPIRLKFTPNGRHVLVSTAGAGAMQVFDARARMHVATIALDAGSAGGQGAAPVGILIDPAGTRAWVSLTARDAIAELDLAGWKVTRYIDVGRNPDGLAMARVP